jgi:RNA polymerase sigma-70 factor (sigma-E family)
MTVEAGFAEFVAARYDDLLRTAYLLTGSAVDAEDLVQSALLRVMRGWRRVDDPMAYVRRTMANLHISRWRRHRARELLMAVLPERRATDDIPAVAERDALLRGLRSLPPRTRAVIVLRYWVDLSEVDAAAVLNCSVGSVKSQASRGLARLRNQLEPPVPATATAIATATATATATAIDETTGRHA